MKGIRLAVETILFTVINWPSWSDRPLIMTDVKDEFNLGLPQRYYQLLYLCYFEFL
jgi:hypothetical protein